MSGKTFIEHFSALEFLRRLLPYERGIASHDTLNDVIELGPART